VLGQDASVLVSAMPQALPEAPVRRADADASGVVTTCFMRIPPPPSPFQLPELQLLAAEPAPQPRPIHVAGPEQVLPSSSVGLMYSTPPDVPVHFLPQLFPLKGWRA
jgi:hypothetical protein